VLHLVPALASAPVTAAHAAGPVTAASADMWPIALTLIISLFIPWLSELVTAMTAHPGLKTALSAVLGAATGFFSELQINGSGAWEITLLGTAEGLLVATLSHWNIWAPLNVTGKIQQAFPGGAKLPSDATPPTRAELRTAA
jgi:hypothetical protein